ncbi:MAG: SRPBCC family protein [Cytophagales bacterium]|nr:SRPBCC family protein [Cytophagales bacterium]
MKILKMIGFVIVGLIVAIAIASFVISTDFNYEKTVTINVPIDSVWENVNSLEDMDKWAPWLELDPDQKTERSGIDGTIGAMQSWDSDNPEVGKGTQTIAKIEAPSYFETDLKFYEPYESEAKGIIKLVKNGDGTDVIWGFTSDMPRPFNLMKLTMNMDEEIGPNFEAGLAKLKKLCEN